jgi:hypothetical protein
VNDHADQAVLKPQVGAVKADAEAQFAIAGRLALDLHTVAPFFKKWANEETLNYLADHSKGKANGCHE